MEKKDTTNRINDVLFIAVIILMTVVLTFLGVIYGVGTQNAYTEPKSVSLWRNSNGTELNGSKVTIKAGETVTLTCMLPEKISDSENLFIWNRLLMVDADQLQLAGAVDRIDQVGDHPADQFKDLPHSLCIEVLSNVIAHFHRSHSYSYDLP